MTLIDPSGNVIPEINDNIPTFSMKLPQEVQIKSLRMDIHTLSKQTGLTLVYRTMNVMSGGTVIAIRYPPQSLTFNITDG